MLQLKSITACPLRRHLGILFLPSSCSWTALISHPLPFSVMDAVCLIPAYRQCSLSLWMLGAVSPPASQQHVSLAITAASGFSWNFTSVIVEWEGGFCVLCRPHPNADTAVPCLHFSQQLTLLSRLQPGNDNNHGIYSYETAAWAVVP